MSVEADVAEDCLNATKNGASLYFTSPPEFRNTYGK